MVRFDWLLNLYFNTEVINGFSVCHTEKQKKNSFYLSI